MWTEIKSLHMKLREDINMKNTFYVFVLLFLCTSFAAAKDTAVNQAHRANADGAITNATGSTPEALRHGAGLNFDTANPVKVTKQGKGPVKGYTYTKPNGNTYKVDLNNNIPQPSEAVDATDENSPDKYARKRGVHLRDYEIEQQEPISKSKAKAKEQAKKVYQYLKPGEENLPEEEKNRLEKSRAQAAKRKAEEEKWVDPITQAKTQEEVREVLQKEWLTPELKQVLKEYGVSEDEFIDRMIASHKEYQRSDYKPKQTDKQQAQNNTSDEDSILPMTQGMRVLLTVKGIKPENLKKANNQPVNNQVKNTKKFKLAADIIKADQRLSEKEKQEFLEWDAKIRRQAEELKEKERQEKERLEKQKAEEERKLKVWEDNTLSLAEDIKYGKFNQICDPKIKNESSEACAMCCMHPQLQLTGFDPKIHQMINGYIDSRTDSCHCRWQGKPLTGYDTRNTSNEACNAYCLAHPSDIKGFNPGKHQVHYGELKKGQCKCYYIKKDIDICSREVVHKTDGACARCCMERPINNSHAGGFAPARHNMWGGYTTKYVGCRCEFHDKPGIGEHPRATVMGKHKAALVAEPSDTLYVQAVCNANNMNQNQVECMKCCLAKTPSAPASGYVFDYGFLNEGQCRCHFKNTNKVDVCDNDAKLQSNSACYECCKAQPPAGFDPSIHEIDNAYVLGNECKCSWKAIPQQTYDDDDGPDCSFEEKNRSQSDCNRCCTDPSRGLVGGELESDGICVCLHR